MALATFRSSPVSGSGGGGAGISVQSAASTAPKKYTREDWWAAAGNMNDDEYGAFYERFPDIAERDKANYQKMQAQRGAAPVSEPGGGGGAPAPQLPAVGGVVPAGAGGAGNVPAGGGSPAMAGLSGLALGEGLKEGFNREGWGDQGTPDLTVPGQRTLPASSRALAQLVSQGGKAY